MKRTIITSILALICSVTVFAQNDNSLTEKETKQAVKERRAERKTAADALSEKVSKDAKKQAKKLKKEGWSEAPGALPMEKQLNEMYLRRCTYDGNFPKYIIGQGSATSKNSGIAKKQAVTRARVDVAGQIKTEIAALIEETTTNKVLSDDEVESVSKMIETSQSLIQQKLGRIEVIMELVREKDGKAEVQVGVSYDGSNAREMVVEYLESENPGIGRKIQAIME